MIVSLEGVLQNRSVDSAVIKVGPVSLLVRAPGSTLSQIGDTGDRVSLHTYLYLREDSVALFGFASAEELMLFQQLISVSGIGPRAALTLLSTLSVEQLVSAITGGSADLLSQVPGIGKKLAGRIVLELKGKLGKGWAADVVPAIVQEDADVVAALTSLGYSLREATKAVSSLADSRKLSLEEKVKLALKQLASV